MDSRIGRVSRAALDRVEREDAVQPVDAAVFFTNVTNEEVYLHANDNNRRGFVSYYIGEPRMWRARLRYKFGQ